jgi:hypothetical protein
VPDDTPGMGFTVGRRGARREIRCLAAATLFFVALSLSGAATADPVPATPAPGTIPSGTRIRFHLSAPLASDRNKAGDKFSFALLDPVVVDGQTVVAQGAVGTGTVLVSGHNGTLGHEGDLTLRLDSVRASDVKIVRFTDQQFEVNGGNRKAESRILGLVPDAGIAALFMRGKEVRIDTKTPVQTVLLHPATLADASAEPSASPT